MTVLVDTSVLAEDAPPRAGLESGWAVSIVTVGELEAGVLLAPDASMRAMRLRRLTTVLSDANALPVDRTVAARYAELRGATGRVPSNDLWIAATALAHDFVLMTGDAAQAKLPLIRSELVS